MTAWTLGQTDRFKAAICGAPRFDNESAYGSCDDGPNLSGYQMGGTPWEQRERFVDRSPSARAHLIRTPTLIIHGEADDRCPLNQGEQFFNTLMEIGCETEFVRYPNCSHLFIMNGPPEYRAGCADAAAGVVPGVFGGVGVGESSWRCDMTRPRATDGSGAYRLCCGDGLADDDPGWGVGEADRGGRGDLAVQR